MRKRAEGFTLVKLDELSLAAQAANIGYGEIVEIKVRHDYCAIMISVDDTRYAEAFVERFRELTRLEVQAADVERGIVLSEPLLDPAGTAYADGALWRRETGWKPQ